MLYTILFKGYTFYSIMNSGLFSTETNDNSTEMYLNAFNYQSKNKKKICVNRCLIVSGFIVTHSIFFVLGFISSKYV